MPNEPHEDWPYCTNEGCDEQINPKRWALHYRTCLKCGSPLKKFTTAPAYNKGPYMVIAQDDVKYVGRKI